MTAPASEWATSQTIELSSRYSVEITIGPGGLTCEWSPNIPEPRSLTSKEVRRYRAGRDKLVAELAQRRGGRILLVEV